MLNAKDLIQEIQMEPAKKKLFLKMAIDWESGFPITLYLSPYELTYGTEDHEEFFFEGLGGDHKIWEEFLAIPEISRYQMSKVASEQEYGALKAMRVLLKKGLSEGAGAVQALKEVMSASKLLQQSTKRKQTVVLSYISPKEYPPPKIKEDEA